MLKKPHDVTMF